MPKEASHTTRGLKTFQIHTVEYAFERLYGNNATNRFLIADEVGLGKTLVARGIIGKTLEHLSSTAERIDIVYVCSNSAIASQNVKRLVPPGQTKSTPIATRLTYLPTQVRSLRNNPVNFISLTPTTTFDHTRSRGGHSRERVILYHMLAAFRFSTPWWRFGHGWRPGLLNLLQGRSGKDSWRRQVKVMDPAEIDVDLTEAFLQALARDRELTDRLEEGCRRFYHHREASSIGREDSELRYELIASLRAKLATECLRALEPDLVILDEFQRFKDLLDGEHEAAQLARTLFSYPEAKVLLLSATPYKMFTLDQERDTDDHYPDFLRTLGFLFDDPNKVSEVERLIVGHRQAIRELGNGTAPDLTSKQRLQDTLLTVMCRTERVSMTRAKDSMLTEAVTPAFPTANDLNRAAAVGAVAAAVQAADQVEYWKSLPYLLSFMRNYEFRNKLEQELVDPSSDLHEALNTALPKSLTSDQLEEYQQLDPGNARLRAVLEGTVDEGMWQLLWMPASLPYMEPAGSFRGKDRLTKALVFSSWSAVPNAIAAICSYEAERRMVARVGGVRRSDLYTRNKPLLRFAVSSVDGRMTGMPVVAWLMPSTRLATEVDPLAIAVRNGAGPVSADTLRSEAMAICEQLIDTLPSSEAEGRPDERWYWAAPILLEHDQGLLDWCRSSSGWRAATKDHEMGAVFQKHLELLAQVAEGQETLGPKPADLADVLCDLALGAPGVVALRALLRLDDSLTASDPALLSSAALVSESFRSLFNMPETIALLRGTGEESYWRLTLRYAIDGNLQAVLDEYVHVLRESLGLLDEPAMTQAKEIAEVMASVISLRTAQVRVDELHKENGSFEFKPFNARSRFALRFADIKDDDGGSLVRIDTVRDAFNSPFRPFVLASTSVGQEGLDFHTWCHAVVHWNLPANPVDMEQREGRVHRYKGHAIRKNVAEHYGLRALAGSSEWSDPWAALFKLAAEAAGPEGLGLIPYWVYEHGSAKVERRVPLLPYSREVGKLKRLKTGLALYRLAFGQPRQEDLLAILSAEGITDDSGVSEWLVSLEPPAATSL